MHAPDDSTTPLQSLMRRTMLPWEYRHLRAVASVRFAAGGFTLSGSSGGNWPRSAQMLRVGSVVPGACGVAILWRLYGDEDGPLRTSPNLSLRWFLSSHVSRSRARVDSFYCNC